MTKTKQAHTPGPATARPWRVDRIAPGELPIIRDATGAWVDPERYADLIVAAVNSYSPERDEKVRELAQAANVLLSDSDVRHAIGQEGEQAQLHKVVRLAREVLRLMGGGDA